MLCSGLCGTLPNITIYNQTNVANFKQSYSSFAYQYEQLNQWQLPQCAAPPLVLYASCKTRCSEVLRSHVSICSHACQHWTGTAIGEPACHLPALSLCPSSQVFAIRPGRCMLSAFALLHCTARLLLSCRLPCQALTLRLCCVDEMTGLMQHLCVHRWHTSQAGEAGSRAVLPAPALSDGQPCGLE